MNKSYFIADEPEMLRIKKNVLIPLERITIAFRSVNIKLLFASALWACVYIDIDGGGGGDGDNNNSRFISLQQIFFR